MTPAQCEAFLAVAKHKSFTSAAMIMGVSQSAISHAIKGLEKDLGVSLFIRQQNHIMLTDIGHDILPKITEIMTLSETVRQEAAASKGLKEGHLRIASFGPSFSLRIFPKICAEYARLYPNIEISLEEVPDHLVREWVQKHHVDIGATIQSDDLLDNIPIIEDKLYVLLPPNHILCDKDSIELEDIIDDIFILTEGTTAELVLKLFKNAPQRPKILYRNVELMSVITMVSKGEGLSISAELALPDLSQYKTAPFIAKPLRPTINREISLTVRNRKMLSPAAKAFLEIAEDMREKMCFEEIFVQS